MNKSLANIQRKAKGGARAGTLIDKPDFDQVFVGAGGSHDRRHDQSRWAERSSGVPHEMTIVWNKLIGRMFVIFNHQDSASCEFYPPSP